MKKLLTAFFAILALFVRTRACALSRGYFRYYDFWPSGRGHFRQYKKVRRFAAILDSIKFLKKFEHIDSEHFLNNASKNGKNILAEGAQGSLLDIDFGTYPFVTSSNTNSGQVFSGTGFSYRNNHKILGITKAYTTRVGSGPFPTELFDSTGEKIREIGHEYGATTGRDRRCGWLDLVALKYSIQINGVTELNIMKSDVLSTIKELLVCTSYNVDGEEVDFFPYDLSLIHI